MEAYLHGVSTRKVDDLVRALGADTGRYDEGRTLLNTRL
jgi:transposase-like protein